MSTARPPSGPASGALFGDYPDNIALGLVSVMGVSWVEDFISFDDTVNGRYGSHAWAFTFTGTGTVATLGSSDGNTGHEAGLRRLQVTASGDRAVLSMSTSLEIYDGPPPVGTLWACKIRHNTSTTGAILWAGFSEQATVPGAGLSRDFLGIRNEGANWFGVLRNDLNETLVDLNVAGSTSAGAYLVAGFLREDDGVHFFVIDASDRTIPPQVQWFEPVTVNMPNEDLAPIVGIHATAAGTKGLVVDFFNIAGRTRRS